MCPTVLGRVETRTFTLIGPALLGLILWLVTGNEGFLVLIGILLLEGVALDTAFYPYVIKWQPPWLTFVLAIGEFVILYTLAQVLDVGVKPVDAVWFYWVSWVMANWTKIVVFPIISLSWIENVGYCGRGEAGDFIADNWNPERRRIEIDGRVPVNPHGGSLSEGATTGAGHFREAVLQLRGAAGERQVPGASVALATPGGHFFNSQAFLLRSDA